MRVVVGDTSSGLVPGKSGFGGALFAGRLDVEDLDELLHRRGQHPALAVQDGERPGELLPLEADRGERALLHFLHDGRMRDNGDTVVDLDGALHRLDVVEFHYRRDLELVVAENLVDGLAGRDVGIEADELVAGQRLDVHVADLRQRMLGVRKGMFSICRMRCGKATRPKSTELCRISS